MKSLFLWLIVLVLLLGSHVCVGQEAQQPTDERALIRATLTDYIEGSTNGQPDRLRTSFHPDLNLYSIRNGNVRVWKGTDYIADTKQGQPTGETGKVLSIDFENDAAMAKVEIINPENGVAFIDYFMLLKTKGKWTIIHKMYTRKTSGQKQKGQTRTNTINRYINEQMKLHKTPGLALGIVKNNQLIYEGYFGTGDLTKSAPIGNKTVFPLYSATKLVTATTIFQLVEQGKISLKDEISKHLEGLPTSWKPLAIENLLTHSSGLPDMIAFESDVLDEEVLAKLYKEDPHFEPGSRFEYNQTNYWLLAKVIEKISGQSFDTYVLENHFPGGDGTALFNFNLAEAVPNRVNRYNFDFEANEFKRATPNGGRRGFAGAGLNTTLRALLGWGQRLDGGSLLNKKTIASMWEPFAFKNGRDRFLHGWQLYPVNGRNSYGFTGGGNVGFRQFPDQNLTIVVLTNGHKYRPVHNLIIDHVAGIVSDELRDQELLVDERLTNSFIAPDMEEAMAEFEKLKQQNPEMSFEESLNGIGYMLLRCKRERDAIFVFQLNLKDHPESWNCYDSLGEGYAAVGDTALAIENYKKSIELNPDNVAGKEVLKELMNK